MVAARVGMGEQRLSDVERGLKGCCQWRLSSKPKSTPPLLRKAPYTHPRCTCTKASALRRHGVSAQERPVAAEPQPPCPPASASWAERTNATTTCGGQGQRTSHAGISRCKGRHAPGEQQALANGKLQLQPARLPPLGCRPNPHMRQRNAPRCALPPHNASSASPLAAQLPTK